MTYTEAKEKARSYIEHADEAKIMQVLSLFESQDRENNSNSYTYDEATLAMLRERSEEYRTGKVKTSSLEESMERIRQKREKNGL